MARTTIKNRIISSIICMLIAVAMIIPAAIPQNVYGASETTAAAAETTQAAPVQAASRFTVYGYDITFKKDVITDQFLGSDMFTDSLKAIGKRKSIKLKWSSVKNKAGIAGYIIARKDNSTGRWYQIATVARDKKTFTDKTAKKKNRLYSYILVPYAYSNGIIKIAKPSQWAGAITTRSKLKNVTKMRLKRAAKGSAVRVGGTTKVAVKAVSNKKPYTTAVRWSSSNPNVAKVSTKGSITGVSEGTATIRARMHTGYVFSFKINVVESGTAEGMLDVMRSWMGYSYYNQKNRGIVDIYNSMDPIPDGYKMQYYDAWCDCTISAAAIVSGNADKIGRNCSVPRHVKIFKDMGIWIEGCKTVPKPGDLIVFNWSPSNKNNASHIGIVEKVEGNTITTLEGNMGIGVLGRRTISVGWKYVKGYARPNYIMDEPEEPETPEDTSPEDDEGANAKG